MIKTSVLAATALASFFFVLSRADAAGLSRAWVSGKGTDAAGCGAPTTPCRSLQYVHDNVIAAGGEIDVLDPAGYGAVTITKALSIVNDGVGTAGVQAASGNAITINAGASDVVTLRGLNIDGLGTGTNGIVFNSGGGLTVVDCVIRHFAYVNTHATGDGILIQPSSSMNFLISNVIVSENGYAGFIFYPPSGGPNATGVIDRVTAINNPTGFMINSALDSSGTVTVALSNSIASNNVIGVSSTIPTGSLSIDNTTISGNSSNGLAEEHTVLLGRSVITANYVGVNGSAVYSYGDNRINGNTHIDVVESLLSAKPQ